MVGPPPILSSKCKGLMWKDVFKYLGIWITKSETDFMRLNVYAQLNRLKGDITHWRSLPVSLMGHAVLYKMMALPRLIYILQNVPFSIPEKIFQIIESEQCALLRGGGCPRIALRKLQRGVYDGGLAVPDVRKYYWATTD